MDKDFKERQEKKKALQRIPKEDSDYAPSEDDESDEDDSEEDDSRAERFSPGRLALEKKVTATYLEQLKR